MGVNFKPELVYEYSNTVKKCADETEEIAQNIQRLIEKTRSGWTGAGSEEFIAYLQSIYSELSGRAENLNDISGAMYSSAQQAEEADREAARRVAETAVSTTETLIANEASSNTKSASYCNNSSAARKLHNYYTDAVLKPLSRFAKRYRIKK